MGGGPGTNYRKRWRFSAGRMPGVWFFVIASDDRFVVGALGWAVAYAEVWVPY